MPKFEILAKRRIEDTLVTDVRFTFDDRGTVDVSIPHFQPHAQADVEVGIRNRYESERIKRAAADRCDAIAAQLPTGEVEV